MQKIFLFLIITFLSCHLKSQTVEISFEVFFKGKSIGHLYATEEKKGKSVVKDLRTNTEVDIIAMSIHVESEVKIFKKDEELLKSKSFRHANRGTEEISSQVNKINSKEYEVKRNGEEFKINSNKITYCTVDLYFIEPVDIKAVFSTMYAEFLDLQEVSPHRYKLSSPRSKDTYYTYENGALVVVEIDTRLGMVTCKRTN